VTPPPRSPVAPLISPMELVKRMYLDLSVFSPLGGGRAAGEPVIAARTRQATTACPLGGLAPKSEGHE